jgi:hypothetical protein
MIHSLVRFRSRTFFRAASFGAILVAMALMAAAAAAV